MPKPSKLSQRLDQIEKSLTKLEKILEPLVKELEAEQEVKAGKIIISCDASITKNPGGQASVGYVIRHPDSADNTSKVISQLTPAKTNNEAELDAIYSSLVDLKGLHLAKIHTPVEVRSDSQLAVDLIQGRKKTTMETLGKRVEIIQLLLDSIMVLTKQSIEVIWHPRCSTADLKAANDAAQTLINVPNH